MMYKVYIIKSDISGKYYVGHTKDLMNRLNRHNKGLVRSTKSGVLWKIVYAEDYIDKNSAYRREMQIKSYKGGMAFKKLVKI
jgi:putative endonuclease